MLLSSLALALLTGCDGGFERAASAPSAQSSPALEQIKPTPVVIELRPNDIPRRAGTYEYVRFEVASDKRYFVFRIVEAVNLTVESWEEPNSFGGFDVRWLKAGEASLTVEACIDGAVAGTRQFEFEILPAITFLGAEIERNTRIALYLPGTVDRAERLRLKTELEATLKATDANDAFNISLAGEGSELISVEQMKYGENQLLPATAQNIANARTWLADNLPGHSTTKSSLYAFFQAQCQVDFRDLDTMILVVGASCLIADLGDPGEALLTESTPLEEDYSAWWCKFDHGRLQIVYLGRDEQVRKALERVMKVVGGQLIRPD